MKKKFIFCSIIVFIFILVGCTNNKEKQAIKVNETEKETYLNYVKKLKKVTESSEDLPFTVETIYDKLDNEIRYQVIIDNPKEDITNISALVVHNKQTDDVFPSIGIFDKKVNLIKDEKPSGVILVGYIPYDKEIENFECEIKVIIKYKINDNNYTSYYVTKK